MTDNHAVQQYIVDEMKRRGLSIRQFADLLGYSASTFVRYIDAESPAKPTVDLINRLVKVVDDPDKLIQLVYPELAVKQELSVTALSVARKFDKLSKEMQRAILAIIQSAEKGD